MTDKFCPILTTNVKKPISCQKHACEFYQHIIGKDAQNGNEVDEWACAHILSMRLQITNAMKITQNTASLDKLSSAVVEGNNNFLNIVKSQVMKLENSSG